MVWKLLKLRKQSLVLEYGFSNTTFEPPNHAFAHKLHLVVLKDKPDSKYLELNFK
jgi:hypothetical protein